jgi:tetratricopeptide (TPR) repeat protein
LKRLEQKKQDIKEEPEEDSKPSVYVSNKIKAVAEKRSESTFISPSNSTTNFFQKKQDTMTITISELLAGRSKEENILLSFLKEKFIPSSDNTTNAKLIFNLLIQIKPPEGINAVVASPLIDSKGWAPAIPSVNIDKSKTNLGDLMMRAKGGIQAGDITKESHMAFHLGLLNEEEGRLEESLKFYKKYFLSAQKLQDLYGTELALNRLAVIYSKLYDYGNIKYNPLEQSLYYNIKHKDISSLNVNGYVANYNCGICQRITGKIEDSIRSFDNALKLAEEENDLESCILCICQLGISYIFLYNGEAFFQFANVRKANYVRNFLKKISYLRTKRWKWKCT